MTRRSGAARAVGSAARAGLTIGKVLAELGQEFPDVSASKIRFLETEGLVTPERTASGYRTYSPEDLDRLRYILTAQRDRFWPLKVIREALDALDRGLDDPGDGDRRPRPPATAADPEVPVGAALRRGRKVSMTGPELRASAGLDKETFTALENFGLLQSDAQGHYGAEAIDIVAAARQLAAHGLEPRHLRPFRTAADREIGLAQQVVATRRGDGSVEERTADVVSACIALHVALVKAGLTR